MNDTSDAPVAVNKTVRKRYESPAVEETGDFERLVLSCGHTPEQAAMGGFPECEGAGGNS